MVAPVANSPPAKARALAEPHAGAEHGRFNPREHPVRSVIQAEIHARPVTPLPAPLRIRRAAFMPESAGELLALRDALQARFGVSATDEARQLSYVAGDLAVTVELHNEFATLTWTSPAGDWTTWPEGIGLDIIGNLPLIAATRVDLMDSQVISEAALAGFQRASFCHSKVFGGTAEVATDFLTDADGFTRFEVAAGSCGDITRGIIVRRLLEIDTYRTLALLGLPLARSVAPRTREQERRLGAMMDQIRESASIAENRTALDALHALSIEVGRTVEETGYRFAASQAYAEVFRTRVERLEEVPVGEATTLMRYLENRLDPALKTSVAIENRLLALANKLQRSTELLNARISLSIESQNQEVLDTISMTARSQYRLQQTVEGLSILAISYYALSLLGYIMEGVAAELPFHKSTMLAVAAPVVILLVWLGIRRLRRVEK